MNKDKLTTWAMVAALCGCAAKMVMTLKEHGAKEETIEEDGSIEE